MKNSDDKHVLKFIPRSEIDELESKKLVYGSDEVFLLPCMKCKECRKDYARDWAVRCCLEAKEHKYNYFLTLTYDEYHVQFGNKKDFSEKFLKKLNYKLTGTKGRPLFFACMERGELTHRLHFHCVLFLDHPLDLKLPVKIGDFYHYSCDLLTDTWSMGFVDVAPFETDCAAYVAKYSTKQGKCFMSRNLGKSYYLKHKKEIAEDGFKVYGDFFGKEYTQIPSCFVRWFIQDEFEGIDSYKLNLKQIQRLAMFSELHSTGKDKEGMLIRDKILLCLKHNKYKGDRSEL